MALLSDVDIAVVTETVASALNVSVIPSRNTVTRDAYGHDIQHWVAQAAVDVNVIRPNATLLQTYASIIGAQRALVLRFLQTSDIREDDQIPYDGKTWTVQSIMNDESFTVTRKCLMTAVI